MRGFQEIPESVDRDTRAWDTRDAASALNHQGIVTITTWQTTAPD